MSSYNNPSEHPHRPGILRQGSGQGSTYQNQKVVNLGELGLLPRKESARPVNRRNNSSQAPTRPQLTTEKSSQSVHQQRPTLNRNISNLSTQSPSGRVYLPPPPVGRENGQRNKSKTTLLNRIANHQARRAPDPNPIYSNPVQTSFNWRSGRPMAGMLELERSRTRRERTFIGSECAVCEEPLEHTLRGERILQFSCGHVSHEACFYEYIKEFDAQYCPTCNAPLGLDTSRGGNVLDIEKLSSIVRSVSTTNNERGYNQRSAQNTPVPWDQHNERERPKSRESNPQQRDSRESQPTPHNHHHHHHRDPRDSQRERVERYHGNRQQHARNESGGTGGASTGEYQEVQNTNGGRKHDYDVQSMETALSSPRASMTRNPIPAPAVTVRSEYPTLSRSRQQQSLTCLVTIEVPEGKWSPDPADLRGAPVLPPIQQEPNYPPPAARPGSPASIQQQPTDWPFESSEHLGEVTEDLRVRVDNWHGLDFQRFGKLRLYGTVRVGKDRQSWQELECFLFTEMLICVKEKRGAPPQYAEGDSKRKLTRCTLKGSILIKKHLKHVDSGQDEPVLTLSLSVQDLQQFHLLFQTRTQVDQWKRALLDLDATEPPRPAPNDYEQDNQSTDEDDYRTMKTKRVSSVNSSFGAGKSVATAPTEYTNSQYTPNGPAAAAQNTRLPASMHVPLDLVVVIPVSSSMQGLKITLLRDALKFLVQNLGERDRMGLVTFGSSGGGVPLVGMTTKTWTGWTKILNSIRPVGQKSLRADVVEGANVAMDLLMQRKANNPIATILLISDSSTSDAESVDFVVSRAEAAKVAIHSFGLGLTHKPDTMIELSTRTKASYTYVKDWMMLRECVAGCLGSMQTTSHQNVKLKLRLPEGSPAKFVKISGALQITKRATGKDAEAALGDLRFGDKRDILVQLVIAPDNSSQEHLPQDAWESIVSGLEALGGPFDSDEQRSLSVEEVPLIQADLTYGDILRDGTLTHLPRPSLLAITMLPANPRAKSTSRPLTPPIPPHPSIVQRRMELLTSDMLTRALTLVSRGQHDRAHHLLKETRTILKGLGKGGLPPLPQSNPKSPINGNNNDNSPPDRQSSPSSESGMAPASGIDAVTLNALDTELEASLEWINHPAVFGRDSRKAVLQAIGVIASQRGYSFRTPAESLWAGRIGGVKRLTRHSREWRDAGDEALMEEQ
ncbi:MAG: hypothetical protein Q9168_007081 [Polycauliona sp. 1 TL-2023]